jgi:acetyl/propionyl-CoA carboxylase alpha subunit
VGEQLRIAAGEPLGYSQEEIRFHGHSIECRICAEDVDDGYMPSTGSILFLRPPGGPGIREDRGFEEGSEVSVYYDSLISKLLAWAPDRSAAIARMTRALREYTVLGVKTNIRLCMEVLANSQFRSGKYSTRLLDRALPPESLRGPEPAEMSRAVALVAMMENKRMNLMASSGLPASTSSDGARWKSRRLDSSRD